MKKQPVILTLAAALAALAGDATAAPTPAKEALPSSEARDSSKQRPVEANVFYNVGEDLLGLLVTERADGTVVAQHASHYSHSSHSSHSSHQSHSSSRF
jgi:hypothetical protein